MAAFVIPGKNSSTSNPPELPVKLLDCGAFSQPEQADGTNVRTRFALSPTGVLRLRSVRTSLFCWLYARHHGGQFVLRIEDTDRKRSTLDNVDAISDGMAWLGLEAGEGPYR